MRWTTIFRISGPAVCAMALVACAADSSDPGGQATGGGKLTPLPGGAPAGASKPQAISPRSTNSDNSCTLEYCADPRFSPHYPTTCQSNGVNCNIEALCREVCGDGMVGNCQSFWLDNRC